jgi:branched-chain amino acid transport system substrate-binding protein
MEGIKAETGSTMRDGRLIRMYVVVLGLILGLVLTCPTYSAAQGKGKKEVIKLGLDVEKTGALSGMGISVAYGAQIAADEINAMNLPYSIELVIADNESRVDTALTVATKLIEREKVSILIGGHSSANMIGYQQVVNRSGIPCIQAASVLDAVTLGSKTTFNTGFTMSQQADEFARLMVKHLAGKKVAYLSNPTDASQGQRAGFIERIKGKNIEIVKDIVIPLEGMTDYSPLVTKLRMSPKPDAIIHPISSRIYCLLDKAIRESGWNDVQFIETSWGSPEDYRQLAPEAMKGAWMISTWDPDMQGKMSQTFVKKYKERFPGAAIHYPSAGGYDAVYVAKHALDTGARSYKDIVNAIRNKVDFTGLQGRENFDQRGWRKECQFDIVEWDAKDLSFKLKK